MDMESKDQFPSSPASHTRRTEDIALDLLKFVAAHAQLGAKSGGSTTGFAAPSSVRPEDQVEQMLKLYARCREAVEEPVSA